MFREMFLKHFLQQSIGKNCAGCGETPLQNGFTKARHMARLCNHLLISGFQLIRTHGQKKINQHCSPFTVFLCIKMLVERIVAEPGHLCQRYQWLRPPVCERIAQESAVPSFSRSIGVPHNSIYFIPGCKFPFTSPYTHSNVYIHIC